MAVEPNDRIEAGELGIGHTHRQGDGGHREPSGEVMGQIRAPVLMPVTIYMMVTAML